MLVCFTTFDRNFCAPAVLMTSGFWFSSLWAWIYQDNWGGFKNPVLYKLIILGILSFCVACFVVQKINGVSKQRVKPRRLNPITIPSIKVYLYLFFELLMAALTIYVIRRNVELSTIFNMIGDYYNANKYERLVYDPFYFNAIQYFNIGGVFIFGYVILNNKVCKKRNTLTSYLVVFFGFLLSLLQGTRNTFFMFIIGGGVLYGLFIGINNGWKANITIKSLIKGLFSVVLLIGIFRLSIHMTGRSSDEYTFIHLISTYIGSPLKNLELFISESRQPSSIFGGVTLMQSYNKLYGITGNADFYIPSTNFYTYRWLGSTGLGNVYTILMPLYQDFGVLGACVVMALIGALSQKQFDNIKQISYNGTVDNRVLIYAYCAFSIVFSFFSNKYFEMVISVAFIYVLIGFFLVKGFILHLFIFKGKIIIKQTVVRNIRHIKGEFK